MPPPPPPPPPPQPQVVMVSQIETEAQAESVTEGLAREMAHVAASNDVDASATTIVQAAGTCDGPTAALLRQAAAMDAGDAALAAAAAFGVDMLRAAADGFKQALRGDAEKLGESVYHGIRDAGIEVLRARVEPRARHWWQRLRAHPAAVDDEVRSIRALERAQTASTLLEVAKLAVAEQEEAVRRAADETEAAVAAELERSGLFDAEGARTVARCARREALRRAAVTLDPAG